MRLFYAIPTDTETQGVALGAIERLRRGPGDYRWSTREDLHTTLCFLGETAETEVPHAEALLQRVAAETAPFTIAYETVGAFDTLDDPRVLWLGVSEGTASLASLAAALGRTEPRPFCAHLTLGYRRGDQSPPGMAEFLGLQPAVSLRRPVTSIALFASAPRGVRPAYQQLCEAPLGGSLPASAATSGARGTGVHRSPR